MILITHKHGDHCNYEVLKQFNIPIYSTNETKNTYPDLEINIVKENDTLTINDIQINVVKAIHGYNPLLKGGKEVFENVGYIINDGNKKLYVTSDTICFNNNYKADIVALPITAYGLTMPSYEATLYAKELEASLVIPIHMDNDLYPTNLEYMKENFNKYEINYRILEIGEA